jgi:hypothetical protein
MKAIIISCVFCTLLICLFVVFQSEDLGHNKIKTEHVDRQGLKKKLLEDSHTLDKHDVAVFSPSEITNKQVMSLPNAPKARIVGGSQIVDQIPAIEKPSGTTDFISSSKSSMPVADKSLLNNNLNQNLPIANLSNDSQSEGVDMEISIPSGARLPAAIVDASKNLTPTQTEVMDAISEKFLDSAMPSSNVPQDPPQKNISEKKWSQSLNEANERYRSLFGVDAYNAWTSQAAKEALNDQL